MSQQKWVVGITGASGAIYGVRVVTELLRAGHIVHLMITEAGWQVFHDELDWHSDDREGLLREKLQQSFPGELHYWGLRDFNCPAASGSYRCDGMIVVPCSMGTVSGIAHGASGNLLERVADVMIKEGRRQCDPAGKHADIEQAGCADLASHAWLLSKTANDG
jgi:4-hydroxy-3-polyprenylbenzoate decarboxylase